MITNFIEVLSKLIIYYASFIICTLIKKIFLNKHTRYNEIQTFV